MPNFKKRYVREITSITGVTRKKSFASASDAFDCVKNQYTKAMFDRLEAGEVIHLKLGKLKLIFYKE